jgi:hypothetical protein
LSIGDNRQTEYVTSQGQELRVPVRVVPGQDAALGQAIFVNIRAWTGVTVMVPSVDEVEPRVTHSHISAVAELPMPISSVLSSELTVASAADHDGRLVAIGTLTPGVAGIIVAVDYVDPTGATSTRLAVTDDHGSFQSAVCATSAGTWTVRAFWQGDLEHAGAVAQPNNVSVGGVQSCVDQPTPKPLGQK